MYPILPNTSEKFHSKINAANVFKKYGLDGGRTLIVDMKKSAIHNAKLFKIFGDAERLTIRFASGSELGLPTLFLNNGGDIHEYISSVCNDYSYAVVQPYIEVANSFELYISAARWIAEHVPGVWESSENTPPDVVSCDGANECSLYLWSEIRNMRLSNFGENKIIKESKLSRIGWINIVQKISCFVEWMRKNFGNYAPLIVHFVISECGEWRFLNIRDGSGVDEKLPNSELPYHKIRTLDDLSVWSGNQPLLLDFSLSRGRESEVLALGRSLPKGGVPVYVKSGMLSHPAIVLRSMGVDVQSAMGLFRGDQEQKGYQRMDLEIDVGDKPIERIFSEPAVVEDADFHIVRDREPIGSGHLLLVTKKYAPSVADAELERPVSRVLSELAGETDRKWVAWERGRAEFCTSRFTTNHAHCHFLPLQDGAEDVLGCFNEFAPVAFPDLASALNAASDADGEYLWVQSSSGRTLLFTPSPITPSKKRFVRERISSFMRCAK